MPPVKLRFIWPSGFREKDFFYKSTNQKQELPVTARQSEFLPLLGDRRLLSVNFSHFNLLL
jgi:hypothetical protein